MYKIHLDVVDSTNNYAREILPKVDVKDLPLVVSAGKQTAGRGRQGHTFYSPEGTGVYMTFADEFNVCDRCLCPTAACAVAVFNCLAKVVEKPELLKIKWVNDIYYDRKKVCGILTESFTPCDDKGNIIGKYLITGVGININTKDFPKELEEKAGSLLTEPNEARKTIGELPEKIAQEYYDILSSGTLDYMDTYRANSFVISQNNIKYTENGIEYEAKVLQINDDASLLTELSDGRQKVISSGEINIDI